MRSIRRRAAEGDRIEAGRRGFGYRGALSDRASLLGDMDPFGGYMDKYLSSAPEDVDGGDVVASEGSGGGGEESVNKLFGQLYGSAEAPNATLRRKSDRLRDRMARRKFRALKAGEEYDPSEDKTLAGKRFEKVSDKYTGALSSMMEDDLDFTDEAYDDMQLEEALGTGDGELRMGVGGYKNTERLREKMEELGEKPQDMQSAYAKAYETGEQKEQMRKEQGRYGYPYTSNLNMTEEQLRRIGGENKPKSIEELGLKSLGARPKSAIELGLKSVGGLKSIRSAWNGTRIRPIR